MARTAAWYVSRLRAMSAAEIAHRAWRAVRHPVDLVRMRAGLYARPPEALARWTAPPFSLPALPDETTVIDDADRVCRGERQILGLGWITVPDQPWHYEPLARTTWPRVDAARVLDAAPDLDARLTWELSRGHDWVILARAFAQTGDARYRDRLGAELAAWRLANPLGVGVNWASAMEAAIRIHALAWVASFVRDPGLGPSIAGMLHAHGAYVADHLSLHSSANNHLIVELTGLAVAARCLGRDHAGALEHLDRELDRQVFRDGVGAEMATHYHAFVLEATLLAAVVERACGAPRPVLERHVAAMTDYLAALLCEDDSLLQQGDSDDGKLLPWFASPRRLVDAARAFVATGSLAADHPPSATARSRVFRDGGQVVLRSARLAVAFDAGPFGFGSLAAHAHCDALAIAVALDGKRFVVDRGTYCYRGAPDARAWFRSTAAHNTVQIAAREQADSRGPFLWGRRPDVRIERCELGDGGDVVVASHDGFAPIGHRRTLVRAGDVLLVVDEVTARARVARRYHLPPELSPLAHDRAVDVPGVGMLWLDAPVRVIRTRHSDRYAQLTTAPTIECEGDVLPDRPLLALIGPHGTPDLAPACELAARVRPELAPRLRRLVDDVGVRHL